MQKEKISPQQNAAEAAKNIPLKQESPNSKHKLLANSRIRDSSSKIIFDDNLLCSQFLRGYIDLDAFKNVKPEDIEDVSSQFVPLFEEERNADRVKKVGILMKRKWNGCLRASVKQLTFNIHRLFLLYIMKGAVIGLHL